MKASEARKISQNTLSPQVKRVLIKIEKAAKSLDRHNRPRYEVLIEDDELDMYDEHQLKKLGYKLNLDKTFGILKISWR